MEHLGVGLALRALCGVEELETVCDAQPGEHLFALLCPGVGADAHPHALGFQPGQHLPDAGLQLNFFVQVPDDLPHGRLVVPEGQGQIVGADEILRALHHPHAQKNTSEDEKKKWKIYLEISWRHFVIMNCRELITFLETEVPLETAEGWDNPGFLVGDKDKEIKKVLVVLDITNEAVDYAIDQKADFILAHHPIIFSKINKCTSDDFLQKKLLKLIRHDICAYGMHTCYDVCRMGDQVADRLNLKEIQGPVELSKSHNEKAFGKGIGIVAKIEDEISVGEYAKKVKEAFSLENVMVFGNLDTKISKLAVVPGSGRSMISEAKSTGADVFLTGDIGHHEGLDAVDMGMCVIDAGHYGLEQVFIDDMKDLIRTHFSDMNVITYKAGSPYKVV